MIGPCVNVNPITSHLYGILQILNQRWNFLGKNLRLVLLCNYWNHIYWVHQGQNHLSISTWSKGGVKHAMCLPLKHQSQTNIAAGLMDCPHIIHHKPTGIMAKDGSIWPSTLKRWHSTQLGTWSFHVWPSHPSNNNTSKGRTFQIHKITQRVVTSNVVGVVYYK